MRNVAPATDKDNLNIYYYFELMMKSKQRMSDLIILQAKKYLYKYKIEKQLPSIDIKTFTINTEKVKRKGLVEQDSTKQCIFSG